MSLADPQFIKATIVHQDQAYDDKIYYFFREDNPDKNPEAPLNVSRVAQLCRVSVWPSGQECVSEPEQEQGNTCLGQVCTRVSIKECVKCASESGSGIVGANVCAREGPCICTWAKRGSRACVVVCKCLYSCRMCLSVFVSMNVCLHVFVSPV